MEQNNIINSNNIIEELIAKIEDAVADENNASLKINHENS